MPTPREHTALASQASTAEEITAVSANHKEKETSKSSVTMATPQEHAVLASKASTIRDMSAASLATNEKENNSPPTLMTIPTEIRLQILKEVVTYSYPLQFKGEHFNRINDHVQWANMSILLCSKQLYREALPQLFSYNTFDFEPGHWEHNDPPLYAFSRIQHIKVRLDMMIGWNQILSVHRICRPLLPRFGQLKTLTLYIDEHMVEYLNSFLAMTGHLPPHNHNECKIRDVEVVVEGAMNETLRATIRDHYA